MGLSCVGRGKEKRGFHNIFEIAGSIFRFRRSIMGALFSSSSGSSLDWCVQRRQEPPDSVDSVRVGSMSSRAGFLFPFFFCRGLINF